MYINKFSTGTILALLAMSGMLFLVPLAGPVHASQNASLPSTTASITAYIYNTGTAGTTLKISNPISNSYAITSITIFVPSGFAFTASTGTAGTYLNDESIATIAAETFTISGGSAGIAPGFTDTVTLGTITASTASPVASPPPTATFTTTVIDAGSSPASYPGPSWTVYDVATGTSITVTGAPTTYTAGSSPVTITANDGTTQPGVPVTFKVTTAPAAGFTATVTPSSGVTGTAGTVTTSFQPSNHAGDATTITGTIGGGSGALTGQSGTTTTVAAAPSTVTFSLASAAFPSTDYVTASFTPATVTYANIASGQITYAATDAYGNPAGGSVTSGTLTAANGFFGGVTTTTTCTVITNGATCGSLGSVPQYSQSGAYGAIGQISATLTGTGFSVSGVTGFIQTSTFATAATFTYPVAAATTPADTALDYKVQLTGSTQSGVPVKIEVCVHSACAATSAGYAGTFSNGLSTISGVTNSSGSFGSVFTISTKLGAEVELNASISRPQNGANPQSFYSALSTPITTGPGVAAALAVYAVFLNGQGTGNSGPATSFATSGATLYIDVVLTDAYGNVVTNTSPQQVQVNLAASGVSGGGLLGVTQTYFSAGSSSTNDTAQGSFGPVAWTLPATLGASTVTASAVIAGKAVTGSTTVTTISPIPTINVKSPLPVAGVIYSSTPFVTFSGKANASLGYPSTVTITSIGYKVNSGHWTASSVAAGNKIVWSVPVTLATGLSTIQFNATDSKSNVGLTSVYTVLVDSVAPTVTFAGTTSNTGCEAVTVTTAAGDLNEATSGTGAFTATFGGVAIPAADISFSGTQTLGTAGSVTATICGLTSQTALLSVTATTLTGVSSGAVSETLTVTVPFADSVTFTTGSATWGQSGAASGIFVPVTNSWNTALQLTIYATLKSGSSTYVLVGGETIAAGQTSTVFLQDFLTTVPAGTYTVTFSSITTSNTVPSAPTTAISVTT
jgi:hypothetical protein